VENFRPGVLDALGLGEDWLKANHPRVIVASISGFGHVGPRSGEACFDQVAQGMGGLMSLTGTRDSGPMRSGIPLADPVTVPYGVFRTADHPINLAAGTATQWRALCEVIGARNWRTTSASRRRRTAQ
jgi:crotonobetainyl-CoA:carnitine CoA-transferase CaiB-like acyl-CoA transferase